MVGELSSPLSSRLNARVRGGLDVWLIGGCQLKRIGLTYEG